MGLLLAMSYLYTSRPNVVTVLLFHPLAQPVPAVGVYVEGLAPRSRNTISNNHSESMIKKHKLAISHFCQNLEEYEKTEYETYAWNNLEFQEGIAGVMLFFTKKMYTNSR